MAANLTTHGPIVFVQSVSQKGPFSLGWPEKAGQTFQSGTPVQPFVAAPSTFVQAWDGTTFSHGIWGFSYSTGSNLPTNGAGAPIQFGPVGPPRSTQTFGAVINQPAAVNIAVGSPASDGRTLFMQALPDTIFEGTFDDSTGAVAADYTPGSDLVGTSIGLTIDPSGFWYPDGGVTGADAVIEIVGANPDYGFGFINGRVRFKVIATAQFSL
jgi:hypothetical protein